MKQKRTIQTVQKSIAAFFRDNRRMPSFSEMVGLLGVRSKSVVNFWIDKLIEAEILEKDDKRHLKFKKSTYAIPMAGSVQAGFPAPEEEALCDILSMDEYLITKPDASFLLQVSGDSMNGEGIMEGDLVIVISLNRPIGRSDISAITGLIKYVLAGLSFQRFILRPAWYRINLFVFLALSTLSSPFRLRIFARGHESPLR